MDQQPPKGCDQVSLLLNEPFVKAVYARLSNDFEVEVSRLNDALNEDDPFTIDSPLRVLDYIPPLEQEVSFPILAIQDLTSELADDQGHSGTGVHKGAVIAYIVDADPRTLAWKLRRYAQAIANVVYIDRAIPGVDGLPTVWGLRNLKVQYGPTLEQEESPRMWMSWCGVSFEGKCEEDG